MRRTVCQRQLSFLFTE